MPRRGMTREFEERGYPPDFVSAETLAYRLNCSMDDLALLESTGKLPKPIAIGHLSRWDFNSVRELFLKRGGRPEPARKALNGKPAERDALEDAVAQLAETTQRQYAERLGVIERIWGKVQVQDIRPKHVRQLRDKFVDTPSQADHLITVLSSMLSWGVVDEWLEMNPCLGMRKLKFGCDGSYEAWDAGMVELFKRRSIPHLWWAAALALYTGQRRADCLKMRWTDYRGGLLYVQQQKTKKKLGIPMHKELAKVWEVLPRTSEYVLTTTTGRQWTHGNFGTAWHRQMRQPEFASFREQRLTFHGLRHTAVNALLEAGCTTAQVRAITGQTSEMVEHYAKQVDQEKLARQAIAKVEAASDARAAERGEQDCVDDDAQGWLFDTADIA